MEQENEELPNFSIEMDFNTCGRNQQFTDDEVKQFVEKQRNQRTVKKTNLDVKKFLRFLQDEPYSEKRSLCELSPAELDNYLSHFLLEIRKSDGEEYEPDSLTSYRNSIDRYLREKDYRYSLVESRELSKHREILKAKRKELKGKGKGRKPNAAQSLSKEDRTQLYKEGYLGRKDPQTLQTTVWLNNTLHFGMRSCQEHYDMKWGDVSEKSTMDGKTYLQMEERISKGRDGSVPGPHSDRPFKPKIFETGGPNCPVETYRVYRQHRPHEMLDPEAPFYLQTIQNPSGEVWFKRQRLGINTLGRILKQVGEKAGLNKEKNIRNHSGRKTLMDDLCNADVPGYRIIQLTGHKSVESIQDYHKKANISQQEEMSRIISATSATSSSSSNATAVTSNPPTSLSARHTAAAQTQLFGPNTNISGGKITINFVAGQQSTSTIYSPKRKFRRLCPIIESSDSSQEN